MSGKSRRATGSGIVGVTLVWLVGLGMPWAPGSPAALAASDVRFERAELATAGGARYTSVAIGPDSRLYATSDTGWIVRWPLLPDGTTGAAEPIRSLRAAEGGRRLLIGLAFDPSAGPDAPVAYVSHTAFGFERMPDWTGKLSRVRGPRLSIVEDLVVGLPRSTRDHVTNGIAFGPDGALYVIQGSNTAMGAPDPAWGDRPERLLSASVLRLDLAKVRGLPLDVRTGEGGTYDPGAPGAPLTLYATGVRNAYDLVWHSRGRLYAPINGSAAGGRTPGASCGRPEVPALSGVAEQHDWLAVVERGAYYGHPNPLRCELVMNGGNPTAAVDPAEVPEYPVGTEPEERFAGFAHDFGLHESPNGIAEYTSDVFGRRRRGGLLVCRYARGGDLLALRVGRRGRVVRAVSGIPGLSGFDRPLDLAVDAATGRIYVAEYGASRITLLRPVTD